MTVRINGQKDLLAGLIYLASGIGLFFAAQNYPVGTARQMGPGYFPALLGILLALIGVGAMIRGLWLRRAEPVRIAALEPLLLIVASILSFALLIDRAGLVVASFVCLLLACLRRAVAHPLEFLLLFLGLTSFNLLVFVYAFGVQLPVFWWR